MPKRAAPDPGPPMQDPPRFQRESVGEDASWAADEEELPAAAVAVDGAGYVGRIAANGLLAAAPATLPGAAAAAAPRTAPRTPPLAAERAAALARRPTTPPDGPEAADPFQAMVRQAAVADEDARPRPVAAPVQELVHIFELLEDEAWLPDQNSRLISHWTCGRNPSGYRRPPNFFGKPVDIQHGPHARGYKIFIGDLPDSVCAQGVDAFRTNWLQNHPSLVRAVTEINPANGKPWLHDINLRVSPDSGNTMAFLTFSSESCANRCMDVILNWWYATMEGGWDSNKVKWMCGTS